MFGRGKPIGKAFLVFRRRPPLCSHFSANSSHKSVTTGAFVSGVSIVPSLNGSSAMEYLT
ncbi:hypothetical protein C1H46_004355 [Malus baccata]|uniref:Uncharacterized protein n=1 Tax=Malus baccata TaxID=106549 RepID=A0A540NGA2_MALBA|nr:hypothetical protein C1H46_004355 [Malus baccata]